VVWPRGGKENPKEAELMNQGYSDLANNTWGLSTNLRS